MTVVLVLAGVLAGLVGLTFTWLQWVCGVGMLALGLYIAIGLALFYFPIWFDPQYEDDRSFGHPPGAAFFLVAGGLSLPWADQQTRFTYAWFLASFDVVFVFSVLVAPVMLFRMCVIRGDCE